MSEVMDIAMKNINKKALPAKLMGIVLIAIMVLIDQKTKALAVLFLKGKEPYVIIKNVFELCYLENKGAAFGVLQGAKWFFLILTAVIFIITLLFYIKTPAKRHFTLLNITLILLMSGALGNFIDRLTHTYVVDFFYFSLIDFPIFNVADIYVTFAEILLVICMIFVYRQDDLKEIF